MKIKAACNDLKRPFYVPHIEPTKELLSNLSADWKDEGKVMYLAEGRLTDSGIEIFDGFVYVECAKRIAPEAEIEILIREIELTEAIGIALTDYAEQWKATQIGISDAIVEIKSNFGSKATDSKISKWCRSKYSRAAIGHLHKLSSLYEGFRTALGKGLINYTQAKELAYKPLVSQLEIYSKYSVRNFAGMGKVARKTKEAKATDIEANLSVTDISSEAAIKTLSELLCSPLKAEQDIEGKIVLKFPFDSMDIGSGVMDVISRAGMNKLKGLIQIPVDDGQIQALIEKLSREEF